MLHIIGMILKIIGIILAVILGILVLLVCIVLFVPLRYQISANFNGTVDSIRAKVKCSWLLHLISASAVYENGELVWKARIVHKTFTSETDAEETEAAAEDLAVQEMTEDLPKPELSGRPSPAEPIKPAEEPVVTAQAVQEKSITDSGKAGAEEEKPLNAKGKLKELWNKIKAFFENIKYTFRKICDKIKILSEKKEMAAAFVEDEAHRRAFARLKKEAFRLLKFLRPKKFMLRTRFGFEDPYHTGQVLALLSVIYPFVGGQLSVEPDFEKRVLEGELFIKGKIRTMYALITAWNLFWDKNVRRLYADVKRMSGK